MCNFAPALQTQPPTYSSPYHVALELWAKSKLSISRLSATGTSDGRHMWACSSGQVPYWSFMAHPIWSSQWPYETHDYYPIREMRKLMLRVVKWLLRPGEWGKQDLKYRQGGCKPIAQQAAKKKKKDYLNFGWGLPGGPVAKNPPVNAGDMGSIRTQGRSHMPKSN